jgi:hypothetical protein
VFLKIELDKKGRPETVEAVGNIPTDEDVTLICAPLTFPLTLPDNQLGRCAACDRPIQHRPCREEVVKVCIACAPDWCEGKAGAH